MELSTVRAFAIYISVQVFAYCIDIGTFSILLTWLNSSPTFANAAGKVNACVFAFCMHRWFTFSSTGEIRGEAARYTALALLNIVASSALLGVLTIVISLVVVAKIISDVILIAATFAIARTFVFKQKSCA